MDNETKVLLAEIKAENTALLKKRRGIKEKIDALVIEAENLLSQAQDIAEQGFGSVDWDIYNRTDADPNINWDSSSAYC